MGLELLDGGAADLAGGFSRAYSIDGDSEGLQSLEGNHYLAKQGKKTINRIEMERWS